jgi:hypothetical protein
MSSPPADHRTDGEGLIAVLPAPGDATTGPFPSGSWGSPAVPNSINLANMWVDAESSADKVIVSGLVG